MKIKWGHIKLVLIIGLMAFLYGFSAHRNAHRTIKTPIIEFLGDKNLFITQEDVSKLLIQSQGPVENKPKDIIDLNELENALNANDLIKRAEAFLEVDGELTVQIQQKQPLARVVNGDFYVDTDGLYMPLSTNYSARVPLVTGTVSKDNLNNVYKLAKIVNKDEFLKKHVIEIRQNQDSTMVIRLRGYDFDVFLGNLHRIEKKINNLRAFYKKALKDNTLNNYRVVNLKFDNQVVCTKK